MWPSAQSSGTGHTGSASTQSRRTLAFACAPAHACQRTGNSTVVLHSCLHRCARAGTPANRVRTHACA
eukprot:15462600-Alexandrium_andersonii.AAC.1